MGIEKMRTCRNCGETSDGDPLCSKINPGMTTEVSEFFTCEHWHLNPSMQALKDCTGMKVADCEFCVNLTLVGDMRDDMWDECQEFGSEFDKTSLHNKPNDPDFDDPDDLPTPGFPFTVDMPCWHPDIHGITDYHRENNTGFRINRKNFWKLDEEAKRLSED